MFYDNFLKLCEDNNIKPSVAAVKIGLDKSMPSYWKKGAYPKIETIRKIAGYFNVSVDYLLDVPPLPTTTIAIMDNDNTQIPLSSEDQEYYAFNEYLKGIGYRLTLDISRLHEHDEKKSDAWIIHDRRNNIYYSATAAQLNSLMQSVVSYTKFQMSELLSTLEEIPKKNEQDGTNEK